MASLNVGNLGEYLREQRRNAQLSLRQLADAAGVSNPYLSQIERGLRKPSAEVLQQVAKRCGSPPRRCTSARGSSTRSGTGRTWRRVRSSSPTPR